MAAEQPKKDEVQIASEQSFPASDSPAWTPVTGSGSPAPEDTPAPDAQKQEIKVRTVLYPTDFSASAEGAFHLACTLAGEYGARLIVLHALEPLSFPPPEGIGTSLVPAIDPEQVQGQLTQLRPQDSAVQCEHRLTRGAAAAEILRAADESGCDLIVMGTHGRTGLRRLLMGSVAEEVVRKAPCAVLTLRTPEPSTQGGAG